MKKIIFLLLLLVVTTFSFGEESKGLLYKATKGNSTIYLFGGIYISEDNFLPFSKEVQEAFKDSKELILMSSLDKKPNNDEMLRSLLIKGFYFEESLDKHISEETIKLLKERYSEVGVNTDNIFQYKLWFNYMALRLAQFKSIYVGNPLSINLYFIKNGNDKKILGIYSFEEALDETVNMTEAQIKPDLEFSLEKLKKNKQSEIEAWKKGDKEALIKNLDEYYSEETKSIDKNYNERVFQFISKNKLKDKVFMILPVNQLIGNDVLFVNLKKAGYKLKRLN